jgi:hypothetical protein
LGILGLWDTDGRVKSEKTDDAVAGRATQLRVANDFIFELIAEERGKTGSLGVDFKISRMAASYSRLPNPSNITTAVSGKAEWSGHDRNHLSQTA